MTKADRTSNSTPKHKKYCKTNGTNWQQTTEKINLKPKTKTHTSVRRPIVDKKFIANIPMQ